MGDPRMEADVGQGSAVGGDPAAAVECAEASEQFAAGGEQTGRRLVEPSEIRRPFHAPDSEFQTPAAPGRR